MTAQFASQRITILDQITSLLRRGPLNTIQIAERLGKRHNQVNALMSSRPDLFAVVRSELSTRGRLVNVWGARSGGQS